jgi:4-amino-4-deoxy-L-arabinose transferase-like glycosyltransferase
MKQFIKEQETPGPPVELRDKTRPPRWPVFLNLGLVILFLAALAVQLGRGKLWLVGPPGVWALFFAALLVTIVRPALQNPAQARQELAGKAAGIYRRLSPFGLAVALLTLLGLWLRIWGQKNGLPYIIPSDENLIVDIGTRLLKTGDFDPQMYYYPSFYVYQEALVAVMHFLWGSFTGVYGGLEALPDRTFAITTAPQFYLWERTYTALWGTAAIPLAYLIVKKIWHDRRAGLLAAGFIAFSALATEHSHYVAVDMPMATLTLAALWPAWNIVQKGRLRDYLWAGVLTGLAFGTKWNGIVVVILPLTAHLLRVFKTGDKPWPERLKGYFSPGLGAALLSAGLTFVATTPYILARIKGYSDAFGTNITKYRLSTVEYATDYPWLGNLQAIWDDSIWLCLLAGGGALLLVFRHRRGDLLALSFPLLYLLSINSYRLIYRRNVLPLTLYGALFAALFSVWAWDGLVAPRLARLNFSRGLSRPAALGLPLAFLLLTMNGPLGAILYGDQFNDQPFSYSRVENWLKTQAGPGPLKMVEMRPQQWGDYPNLLTRVAEEGVNDFPLDYYRQRGIQYLAINRDRVYGSGEAGSYPELLQPALIAQEFETKAVERPGPAYTVVKTGVSAQTLKLQHPLAADFGGKLRLLGLNAGKLEAGSRVYLPPTGQIQQNQAWPVFKPGEVVGLSVYWQVLGSPGQDYVVFIHLQPAGQPDRNLASRDTPPLQGAYPTGQWKAGEIVTDTPNLALPPDLPPGDYNLVMGLYLPDGKFTPLPLADGTTAITLGQIKVSK